MLRARHTLPLAACLVAALVWPRRAAAQEWLHLSELADEALYGTTLQSRHDDENVSFRAQGVAGGLVALAPGSSAASLGTPFVGLGLGYYKDPSHFLQFRTDLSRPIVFGTDSSTLGGLQWRDFEGLHRARAFFGLTPLNENETGADVEAEAQLAHASPYTTSFLRRDVGAYPFWDGSAKGTAWLRVANEKTTAWTTPLSYEARRLSFDGPTGVGGYTSMRLSSGFGLKPYEREMAHGWIELAGVSWESADLQGVSRRPGAGTIQRIDIRFVNVDGLFGQFEHDGTLNASGFIGGSWLWDSVTGRNVGQVTGSFAVGGSGSLGNEGKDRLALGLAVSHRAGFLADGSGFSHGWRGEAYFDTRLKGDRTGVAGRVAVESQILNAASDGIDRDMGVRTAVSVEWFTSILPGLQLGVHTMATDRCPAGIATAIPSSPDSGAWCFQLGAFLRLRAETKKEDTKPEPKPPLAPPAPAPAPAPPAQPVQQPVQKPLPPLPKPLPPRPLPHHEEEPDEPVPSGPIEIR